VAVFDRAPNGTLTQKPGTAGCVSETGAGPCAEGVALDGAFSVTVSPDGASAYAASLHSDAVAAFDRAPNGTLTQKPGTAGCVSETGAGPCADGVALDGAVSVTVSPDGTSAYVASLSSDAVAVFDREPIPPPPPPPPPAPISAPPAPPPDTARPRLSALELSPARFRAAGRGASVSTRARSRVSYRLSEPARARFAVERGLPGRRAGKRCVKPKRSNRRAKRCTRFATVGRPFAHSGNAGRNAFRFSGRIRVRSKGRLRLRKLAPGRYRLRAVATDAAGNVYRPPQYRAFRIVRR
jgi:DNA-binding beta-propeller fold protein YncE